MSSAEVVQIAPVACLVIAEACLPASNPRYRDGGGCLLENSMQTLRLGAKMMNACSLAGGDSVTRILDVALPVLEGDDHVPC